MSDSTKNYFDILGIPNNSTQLEIKKAFKKLAFQYHPDRNPHNEWAEERFKEAVEAYSYLTGNLEAYRAVHQGPAGMQAAREQAEDILKILFDIDSIPASRRHPRLEVDLNLSLEEAFFGGEKKISLERHDLCPDCLGRGVEEGAKVFTCTYCFGEGRVGEEKNQKDCPKCNGRGFLSSKGCVRCRAKGVVVHSIKFKMSIPPRLDPKKSMVFPGEGHEYEPGKRGDLCVSIKLKDHPRFIFDGKDIICETTVEMSQAALGGEVSVPTLAGPKKIHLSPGTQSGQVIRLKSMGLGGDQLIRFWVRTPKALSEKDRKFFQRLGEDEGEKSHSWWSRIKKWIW